MDLKMEDQLTINKKFAVKYLKKKEHEEISLLRDKYGDDVDASSSSSEEEDEAEGVTKKMERDFLCTLSLLKSKDPAIYDTDKVFFTKADEVLPSNKNITPSEPMHLKDYERKRLLEKGSMAGVSDSESDVDEDAPQPFTYSEEQQKLKENFKSAASEWGGDGGEEKGDILVIRHKTKEEKAEEDRDFMKWLRGGGGGGGVDIAEDIAKDLGHLKEYWGDPSLDTDEKFLRDYILNRGYIDADQHRIPTYDELVASDAESSLPSDSEDEDALDEQETFERQYNFRFEEPDGDLIKSYPRTLSGVVRREDDRRKVKRKGRLEKKQREKDVREEDLGRLRNLKEKEMNEKLNKLASITGNPVESFGLTSKDIETDFDPESYDKAMQNAFSEEYYDEGDDEEKPEFSDLEMEDKALDGKDWKEVFNSSDFNMDADYMRGEKEEEEGHMSRRRRKKQHPNLTLDPQSELHEREELEGRLKGELFRYREVEPVDFGLTAEEILCSDNKELNRWVSLSKAVQYLTPEEEEREKRRFRKRARDWKKKKSILTSYYSDGVEKGKNDERGGASACGHGTKKNKGTSNKHKKLKGKDISQVRLKSYGI